MKELERCKACGLVMKVKNGYATCPACGVPRTVFEPYKETISETRSFILDLHGHPISVHFPQALSVLLIVFLLAILALPEGAIPALPGTITVLACLLPLTALAAFVTGIIDAKVRFKKLSPPYIVKKMVFASLFTVFSAAVAAITCLYGLTGPRIYFIMAGCAGCVMCQAILGTIGIKLMFAKLPGK